MRKVRLKAELGHFAPWAKLNSATMQQLLVWNTNALG